MIYLLLAFLSLVFGLYYLWRLFYIGYKNNNSFKSLNDPIREITENEAFYLAIYLQKFKLTVPTEHQNKVYLIAGDAFEKDSFFVYQSDDLNRYILDNKWVYLPYDLLQFTNTTSNTIEAIIVERTLPYSSTNYYAIPLVVNGHSLIKQAQAYWHNRGMVIAKTTAQRQETALEYDLRQSNLYYLKPAFYLCLTLALFLFASWCKGFFYYLYLLLALIAVGLTLRQFLVTYKKHKKLQPVYTVKGVLHHFTFKHIDTLAETKPEPCLGPRYLLRVPEYIKQASGDLFEEPLNDVVNYTADITAHKSSGFTVLTAQDLPPLDKLTNYVKPTTFYRGTIFLIIMLLTWLFMGDNFIGNKNPSGSIVSNISSMMTEPYVRTKTYTSSLQLFNEPPEKGTPIELTFSEPVACRESKNHNFSAPYCKAFYVNPPSSALRIPNPPEFIISMTKKEYFHHSQKTIDKRMNSIVIDPQEVNVISEPLYVKNIEKACQFNAAFDCSIIYDNLANTLVSYASVQDYLMNTPTHSNTQASRDKIISMLDRPVISLSNTVKKKIEDSIAEWTATSLAQYMENTYHQLDDAYLASNTQKIVIETDSFDVFKSGSLKSEFSDVSQEPFYYLISWFEMIKLRDKEHRQFTISGRVADKNEKDNLLHLTIVTDESYSSAHDHRKQDIPRLLALIFATLSFLIVLFLCFTKPIERRKLTAQTKYSKRRSNQWRK